MKTVRSALILVLALAALFPGHAVAQTEQTSLLPGNGAPLLVTPEVHLTSPAPPVGASNATAGNQAGATTQTVGVPLMANDLGTVPQYAGPAYTVTITPIVDGRRGVAPSTPEVHLGTATPQMGATSATLGNAVGAGNATTALPVLPRASGAVPEFTVRGSTVLIIPPPDATAMATGSAASNIGTGAQQVVGTDGNATEKSLGAIARENRRSRSVSSAAMLTDETMDQIHRQKGNQ